MENKIFGYTKEKWIEKSFPEWGTWLNEEIDNEIVNSNTFAMWWLGCTGIWMKTESANISIDLWTGNGKRSHGNGKMAVGHQMANMSGSRKMQPNLRAIPFVIDPYAIQSIDAVLATHYHHDHMSEELAAHVVNDKLTTSNSGGENIPVPFIGPKKAVETWIQWGVPKDQCVVVKPGDKVRVKDIEIIAVESFDRTCLVTTDSTGADREDLIGKCPQDMDEKAVNYIIKTAGGTVYHSGDSHYSIYYAKHGKDYNIDVAFGSYGENPVGIQDKMTSVDILRMAEALRCKVIIPLHYDVWTNFQADPKEIQLLWNYRKETLEYKFHPFIWAVGGKYIYPTDLDKHVFHYRRGFEDCFDEPQNIPFTSLL